MKFKNLGLIASVTLASLGNPAQAHIEIGTYQGKDQHGQACRIEVKSIAFEADIHHPLNERVLVNVGLANFLLQHLPQIDEVNHHVTAEKGILTSALATSVTTMGLRLKMSPTGPAEFVTVTEDRNFPEYRETNTCSGLERVK